MNKSNFLLVGSIICLLVVILTSCGDDNNIVSPVNQVSTFESIIANATSQTFDAIAETNDGNIIAGGSIVIMMIDSTGVV